MKKDYRINQSGYNYQYDTWHTVGRNMILYVHSGSGNIVSREKNYPITRGSLCFVGSNKLYYTLPNLPQQYKRSKIFVSNKQLDYIIKIFPASSQISKRFTPNTLIYAKIKDEEIKKIEKTFESLPNYAENELYHDAFITSQFIKLLIEIDKNCTESIPQSSGTIPTAIEYINSHINQDIEIDDICAHIHLSKYYFCRKFKKATGTTVMNYILNTRIVLAKSMLEDSTVSISETSEKCGFSSISYFCKAFKENTGITPLKYQKKIQNNEINLKEVQHAKEKTS